MASGAPGRVPPGPSGGGPSSGAPAGTPGFPMPPPNMMPNFPPPLPPGWSEHLAPDGKTPYYYNAATKTSTYRRPVLVVPATPVPPPAAPAVPPSEKKRKKEKARVKTAIPGTSWTRVTTNEGHTFYFEKETKRSEWIVPPEIAEAVVAFDEAERREKEEKEKAERLERIREQERIRAEVAEERKRKADEKKRKAADQAEGAPEPKAQKQDKQKEEEAEEQYAPEGEDEEAWMKAVAAEFAEADKRAAADAEDAEAAQKKAEEEAAKKVFAAKSEVKVSLEEGRALFKALLAEKEISPFAPWDVSLPLFVNDPRYVLLPSEKERREAYEDYCRDAGRARRLNKPKPAAEKKADPEREYRALLREQVTSTRTRWDDFRRKYRKEKAFYSYGRDDREREKLFKTHLRELGERKRADAQRAEADFMELLKESDDIKPGAPWSQAKQGIRDDPRYDAVGSSSLREELFNKYITTLGEAEPESTETAAERKIRERKERQQASLREREASVREQQAKMSEEVDKSRKDAGREEGERMFSSLLTDAIRDAITWDEAKAILQQDRRFTHPALRMGDKQRLFEGHVARLGGKRDNALHALFAQNAQLDTPFDAVYPLVIEDPVVTRLGLDARALEERYDQWVQSREEKARAEFIELLGENSFVDFWGRMRNKEIDADASKIKDEEMADDEEGKDKNMVDLAQNIDLGEIKSILRRDRRYRQFDHMPEEREQWLREYLENLEGSKGSETVHNVRH